MVFACSMRTRAAGLQPQFGELAHRWPWSCCVLREDTEDMNRGRAETHLRQLAEAELRCATTPGALGAGRVGSLPLVA